MISIRPATQEDLPFLLTLEHEAFPLHRQASLQSLRTSIDSNFQEVFIAEAPHPVGALVLYFYKYTARIFSIASLKSHQGQGIGAALLEHADLRARAKGKRGLILEADAGNLALCKWYEHHGFEQKKNLPDYYAPGENALKYYKPLVHYSSRLKNIVVSEKELSFLADLEDVIRVSPEAYLLEERFQQDSNYRVFNFTMDYQYQSTGYYVSLLAAARDHRAIPSVATLQDISTNKLTTILTMELSEVLREEPNRLDRENPYFVILGCEASGKSTKLSKALYRLYEAPFLSFTLSQGPSLKIESVRFMTGDELSQLSPQILAQISESYFSQRKFNRPKLRTYEFDLAILVNPQEQNPPSNQGALLAFKRAAEDLGFFVEFITKEDVDRINEFDALFIRETTSVNDHTYQLSRIANAEGLVVIDDPWSILKCSNKFYLQERMKKAGIRMPASYLCTRSPDQLEKILPEIQYPVVVKQPDSAFSMGVHKADNQAAFLSILKKLLQDSAFVIVQEYIYSPYDWRIGILDGEVLFACRYYMASGHWQIYQWKDSGQPLEGDADTLALDEVPKEIIEVALRATSYIGDGLYGVDLKIVKDQVYLIEINDNPNIDQGVEDQVAGNQLYTKIIGHIKNRIYSARNLNKNHV